MDPAMTLAFVSGGKQSHGDHLLLEKEKSTIQSGKCLLRLLIIRHNFASSNHLNAKRHEYWTIRNQSKSIGKRAGQYIG